MPPKAIPDWSSKPHGLLKYTDSANWPICANLKAAIESSL